MTPAGSACPPITRCDSLIRQRCQSTDTPTPTNTAILGGAGVERTGRGPVGLHQLHDGTLRVFVRAMVKSFSLQGVCRFHTVKFKSNTKRHLSCEVMSARTTEAPLVGE